MAKIARKNQKIFGSSSGLDQIEEFGSLANGTPVFTTDPEAIQSLSNYLEGWFGAVVGANSPAIEDMNALCYLYAYQLAYMFQAGVPEWNMATTYYIGSIVNDGSGNLYVSIQDTNLNHAISDAAWWVSKDQPAKQVFTTSGNFVAPTGVTRVKIISEFDSPLFKTTDTEPWYVYPNTRTFALTDTNGNCWAWGLNGSGQVGNGTNNNTFFPNRVLAQPIQARKVVIEGTNGSSGANGAFIDNYGQMWTWGTNTNGQMGNGNVSSFSTPVMVFTNARFKKFFNQPFGGNNVGAIDINNDAWSWGINTSGSLGLNDVTPRSSPVMVLGGIKWKTVATGTNNFVLGIDVNGVGYGWGENGNGELGLGDITDRSTPTLILGSHVWKQIVPYQPQGDACLGLDTSGVAWAWGDNQKGNLGNGTNTTVSSPVLVAGSHVFKTLIEGEVINNFYMSGGLDTTGAAWMWGNNTYGQLGNNDNSATPKSSPVAVVGGHLFNKLYVTNQGRTIFALKANGELWGWGLNMDPSINDESGVLGNNTTTVSYSSPVLCATGLKFVSLVLQSAATLGIDANGQAWCWGQNAFGNCGTGSAAIGSFSSPVMVLGGHPAMIEVPQNVIEFDVVPGQTYPIVIGYACTFNANVCSYMAKQMTVEYAP